ncbi:hypothetical protein SS50377_21924 [Spironucleus salmonicida]|uniref:Cysteine-rich protein n=1 Tax=Spironucleus salmonicida TaxID=348837 RepID=A0A9P8LXW4_9EUKA|nr:hypothetical protein SS50377_21924 [Spironucleus salmonicida]
MIGLLSFVTNCPVVQQDGLKKSFAQFVNETTVRMQIHLTTESIEVSEYPTFNVTNTIVNPVTTPKNAAGNCFMNAENAFETEDFVVQINNCNFVEFIFNIDNSTMEIVEDNLERYEIKQLYVRQGSNEFTVQIVNELILDDEDNILQRTPLTNTNLQVQISEEYYIIDALYISTFDCEEIEYKVSNGTINVKNDCKKGIATFINGKTYQLNFTTVNEDIIEYTYTPGDESINTEYKNGVVCNFIANQIFEEAKHLYDIENLSCEFNQIIIAGVCVDCMLGQVNVENICTDPNCPDGEIFQENECSPIICKEGFELVGNDCVQIVCDEGHLLDGGICIPIICNQDQELVGDECVPIECEEGQELVNGECKDGDIVLSVGAGIAGLVFAYMLA